jgi:phosphatidylserine/phosphatidylglycerophosphate/cardiolipin synthase-like enzyme
MRFGDSLISQRVFGVDGARSRLGGEGVEGRKISAGDSLCAARNLESVDAQEIGRTQLSIDIAAYVLSDPRIIEALTDAAERGVLIRLYLDKSQFAEHGPTRGGLVETLLAHPNVAARVKGEGVLMHLKAYAVDGTVLRTGSGNFSRSGLASQDNDAIFITEPAIVDAFESNFERIWARAQNLGALDATR